MVVMLVGCPEFHGVPPREPMALGAEQGMEDRLVKADSVVVGGEQALADVDVHAGRVGLDQSHPIMGLGESRHGLKEDQKSRGSDGGAAECRIHRDRIGKEFHGKCSASYA